MNNFYILKKYWSKHKKNAFAMMFSGVLTVAVIFAALMQFRGTFNRELHKLYDKDGMFDVLLPEASDEILSQLIDEGETAEFGYIYALGKTGIGSARYTYGYADDPHGLMHIPLESGVMPENEGEAAVDRGLLNQWNWAGTLGDSITLDNKQYTVVGIIGSEYGKNRISSELGYFDVKYSIPLIYVAPPAVPTQTAYKITLVGGIIQNQDELDGYVELLYENYGEQEYGFQLQCKDNFARLVSKKDEFTFDTRWILILSRIAAQIAVLSVFSVLRSIFIGRQSFIAILRRIGLSAKKIRKMYAVECACFTVAQIVLGTAFGALSYAALNAFQVGVLGESSYSAFTSDILVTSKTVNPFLAAACFGAVITATAYLLTAVTAAQKPRKIPKEKEPRSLRANFSAIFRQRGVTMIQIISLSLIGFGVMLGYMYYTRDGKEMLNYLKFDFPVSYTVGKNGAFDMEKDGIAEYYYCGSPSSIGIQTYHDKNEHFWLADNNFKLGLNDQDVDQFNDITAAGARANGLHNAFYTELFAREDIDGGLLPTSAGARLTSYSELKRREFLENAAESGGLIMLFTLMSLLGFSAYFSGIGIKIRQRAYEISILRSVGTPLKKIRAKLIFDGLAIPLISTAAAGCGVFAVQKITENAYARLELLNSPEYSKVENLYELKGEVIEKFFLENQLWTVHTSIPLVIIFLVTAAVTTMLTLAALRKFKGDIASDLNCGRTRQ